MPDNIRHNTISNTEMGHSQKASTPGTYLLFLNDITSDITSFLTLKWGIPQKTSTPFVVEN